jgi:hypothetical protein
MCLRSFLHRQRFPPHLSIHLILSTHGSSHPLPTSFRLWSSYTSKIQPQHSESFIRALSTAPIPTQWAPPPYCPGCAAPSQQVNPDLPGFYFTKPTKRILSPPPVKTANSIQANQVWLETLKRVQGNKDLLEQLGIPIETIIDGTIIEDSLKPAEPRQERSLSPICERCHNLIHEHHAPPLPAYPTLDTLSKLLLSSPHKFNHIYHLIDAADFPLSLSPRLRNHLYTTLPKSITRHLSVSYIITRCDLLMPKRDQISSLMTYFKSIIKERIPEGEKVEGLPLSNTRLHAISSRVGWEVGILKDEIKQRQGGVWLLGVVNVGKSSLLRDVWPINGVMKSSSFEEATEFDILPDQHPIVQSQVGGNCNDAGEGQRLNPILDRARGRPSLGIPHVPPTISEIPGTTAAPLRVSYKSVGRGGKTRGELVDLPGMERWTSFGETGLTKYVRPEKWRELIMKKRIDGDQYTIKPGFNSSFFIYLIYISLTSGIRTIDAPRWSCHDHTIR